MTGEAPSHCGASGLGCTKPHVPERMMAKTTMPSPAAERSVPTGSSRTPGTAGESAIRRARARMHSTITTSPANTQRQLAYVVSSPPTRGPTATAIAPADATNP